jgi:uncharacterized membrane protein
LDARIRGQRAKQAGDAFEKLVENQLTVLRQIGMVAFWTHTGPTFLRRGKFFAPIAAGVADYSGFFCGGLAFALEAKSTKKGRYPRSDISPQQQAHLDACARAKGLALLALQFRDEQAGLMREFLVPWADAPWERARSAESLTAAGLAGWEARRPRIFDPFVWACDSCGAVHMRNEDRCEACRR